MSIDGMATLLGLLDGWCASLLALLLRQVVLSATVFLVVLLLARVLRGRWPALHCCLWGLVLLRLVLPPELSQPWGAGALLARLPLPGLVGLAGDITTAGAAGEPMLLSPGLGQLMPGASGVNKSSYHSLLLVSLWLVSAGLLIRRRAHQLRRYQQLAADGKPTGSVSLQAQLATWARRLRIRRPVQLKISSAAASPFTIGSLRPVIVLPAALVRRVGTVEAVIAHELAHVARWDSLSVGLQGLLQAIYFFHPLLWIVSAKLDLEREQACDSAVLSYGTITARRYAEALLEVLQQQSTAAVAPSFASLSKQRRSSMRFKAILAGRRPGRPSLVLLTVVIALLAAFLLPLAPDPATAAPVVTAAPPGLPSHLLPEPASARSASARSVAEPVLRRLQSPLPGAKVSWGYSKARDPFTGTYRQHSGFDLAIAAGTPVLAAAAGKVELATTHWQKGEAWGHVVIVDHGSGLKTVYAHLGELLVTTGQRVDTGETLAEVGSTGKSTGPHLHFEVWQHGHHCDPALFVAAWSSRPQ